MKKIAAAVVLGFGISQVAMAGLFGQTGDEQNCSRYFSRGWCVLDAARYAKGVDDTRLEKIERALKKAGKQYNPSDIPTLLMIGGTAGGAFTQLAGTTKGLDLTMLAINLITNVGPDAASENPVLAWIPVDQAATAEEAHALYWKAVKQATLKAFDGYTLTETSEANRPLGYPAYTLTEYMALGYRVTGGECDNTACHLQLRGNYSEYVPGTLPERRKAPEWMGGYEAWVFDHKSAGEMMDFYVGKEMLNSRYAQRLSANLPAWAYVSTAVENDFNVYKMNPGQSVIVVYNKGEAMPLIFPEPAKTGGNPNAAGAH